MNYPFSRAGTHLSLSILLSALVAACGDSSTVSPTALTQASAPATAVSTLVDTSPLPITGFTLIDADTDQGISPVTEGMVLDLAALPSPHLNLRAEVGSGVESVQFFLNGSLFQTENLAPYALAGNTGSDYKPWTPETGPLRIITTAYAQDGAQGQTLGDLTLNLTVINGSPATPTPTPTVTPSPTPIPTPGITMALVDASRDQTVPGYSTLSSGEILISESWPNQLTLRADPQISGVESILFYTPSGSLIQKENFPPYAIAGDNNGDYQAWPGLSTLGEKQVIAQAYSQDNGNGQLLATLDLGFELRSDGTPTPTPTPIDTGFRSNLDLISLHYDHAPDKDDGHSAAADRTILESEFSCNTITSNTLAVAGTYGENASSYNPNSEAVMDTVFIPCGGYINAHQDWNGAVQAVADRWSQILMAGGNIWVKEGGQSDLTADVVRHLKIDLPSIDSRTRIKVIQHSNWNENKTTDADLAYVKQETDYTKIPDANSYLNQPGGDPAFEQAALAHPVFGPGWQSAFTYYDPDIRLDFSDTGELMYILGLRQMGIDEFRQTYLD